MFIVTSKAETSGGEQVRVTLDIFGDSSYLKNEGESNTFEIQSDLVPHAPIFAYVVDFAP